MKIKNIGHYNIECLGSDYYDKGLNYTAFTFTKFNDENKEIYKRIVYVYCHLSYATIGFMDLFKNEETIDAFLKGVRNAQRLEYNYKTKQIRMCNPLYELRLDSLREQLLRY